MRAAHPLNQGLRRAGFTLLEVMLALSIGMVLLVGLYFALNVTLQNMQAGRDVVQQSELARGVLNRIDADISSNLGPISSYTVTALNNWNGMFSGGSTGTSSTAGTTGTTGAGGTTGGSTSGGGSSQGGIGPAFFNMMVQGTTDTLTLYVAMVPRDITNGQDSNDPQVIQAPDLRRIAYWVNERDGLARQEIKAVTSPDLLGVMPPDVNDPSTFKLIAPEVKRIQFQYFDGSNWQDTWDGTQLGQDNMTPQGPPPAIAVTVELDSGSGAKTYRHVVAIPSASNFNPTFLANAQSGATNNSNSGSSTQGTTGASQ